MKNFLIALSVMVSLFAPAINAAHLNLPKGEYVFVPQEKAVLVSDALKQFANSYGLRVAMPTQLKDTINGRIVASNPEDFLNKICALYGLVWHFTDGTLYFSRKSSQESVTISLPEGFPLQGLRKALLDAGVLETKFGWGELADANKVVLYGPPQYRRIVTNHIRKMRLPDSPAEEIYVLKFTHVAVKTTYFQLGDKAVEVPGAAAVLMSVFMDSRGTPPPAARSVEHIRSSSAPEASAIGGMPTVVSVTEDVKNNSVIVRGRAGQEQLLQRLARGIDKPAQSIDVDVAVVDLDVAAMRGSDSGSQLFNLTGLMPRKSQDVSLVLQQLEAEGAARVVTRQTLRTVGSMPARLKFSDSLAQAPFKSLPLADEATGKKGQAQPRVESAVTIDALPVVLGEGNEFMLDLALHSMQARQIHTEAKSPLPGDEGTSHQRQGEWRSSNTLRLKEGSSAIVAGNTYEVQSEAPSALDGTSGQRTSQVLMQRYFVIAVKRVP